MNRATPQMREVAKALMAYEMSSTKASAEETSPAFAVVEKLRPHLANLMGIGGFQALLSRALVLAEREVSWLRKVKVNAAGRLEELEQARFQVADSEFFAGSEILAAQLLGLLVAFIGMTLTMQQVKEVWPAFSVTIPVVADKGDAE